MKKISTTLICIITSCLNSAFAQLPVADFSCSDSTICLFDCISFTNLSTNATSYQWIFQGAVPFMTTDTNPANVCYGYNAGQFDVTLIAINSNGRDSVTKTAFITVNPFPPVPYITLSNDTLFCSYDPSYVSYQWYYNAVIIPGATDSFYVIPMFGNYAVAVTNIYGCTIAVTNFPPEKVQNYSNGEISISPNPVNDRLIVSAFVEGDAELRIYNMFGQRVFPLIHKQGTNLAIDVGQLSNGVYLMEMMNAGEKRVLRFIKN